MTYKKIYKAMRQLKKAAPRLTAANAGKQELTPAETKAVKVVAHWAATRSYTGWDKGSKADKAVFAFVQTFSNWDAWACWKVCRMASEGSDRGLATHYGIDREDTGRWMLKFRQACHWRDNVKEAIARSYA